MKQIYICNDTITGIYSALYDAWKESRDREAGIELKGRTQQQLFCEYTVVEENQKKAIQLERMVKKHLGTMLIGISITRFFPMMTGRRMLCFVL